MSEIRIDDQDRVAKKFWELKGYETAHVNLVLARHARDVLTLTLDGYYAAAQTKCRELDKKIEGILNGEDIWIEE